MVVGRTKILELAERSRDGLLNQMGRVDIPLYKVVYFFTPIETCDGFPALGSGWWDDSHIPKVTYPYTLPTYFIASLKPKGLSAIRAKVRYSSARG